MTALWHAQALKLRHALLAEVGWLREKRERCVALALQAAEESLVQTTLLKPFSDCTDAPTELFVVQASSCYKLGM